MPPKRGFAELSEDLQAQQKRQRRQQPAAVCPRMKTCLDFLTEFLNLPAGYLDSNYDRCYCKVCAERDRIPDVLELDRADGYKYEVPKDWCGFGLKLPPRYASCRTESSGVWAWVRLSLFVHPTNPARLSGSLVSPLIISANFSSPPPNMSFSVTHPV